MTCLIPLRSRQNVVPDFFHFIDGLLFLFPLVILVLNT